MVELGNRNADLHIHSVYSDGDFSVGLILKEVISKGIRFISITDHENTNQSRELAELVRNYKENIAFVPGVEISTAYDGLEIHLLAYYNQNMIDKVDKLVSPIREYKKSRVIETIRMLYDDNIYIDQSIIRNGRRTVNKMILARYLYHNSDFSSVEKVYKSFFGKGAKYRLENTYPDTREMLTNLKSIGCVVGVAHPDFLKDWSKIEYILALKKIGLDGIEVFHPLLDESVTKSLLKFCQENDLIPLGGSDFHGYETKRNQLGQFNTFELSARRIMELLGI